MAVMRNTQEKLDSAFGFWMTANPDTLLLIMAAYGDSLGEVKATCDEATQEYNKFMRQD